MTFMLILSITVIAILILSGRAKNMRPNDWLALAIALLGVNFLRGGNLIFGSGLIAGAAAWSGFKLFGDRKTTTAEKGKPRNLELDQARSLLGVSEGANAAKIKSAWRSRLSEHHPDRGGDEELARQINRARDILLEEMEAIRHK
ncbi:MAG: J domain-containing protein [Parasphingorhabdus sp.]|uniref:J domain-containing protein n=1 Tax=Parasphingorhabdus sp. TaxID=2709688 RepID=UPI0030025B74